MYIYNDNHNWERGSETSAAMICYLKCTVFKKKKKFVTYKETTGHKYKSSKKKLCLGDCRCST